MSDTELLEFLFERMETLEKFMTSDDFASETKRSVSEAIAAACKRKIKHHFGR